MKTTTVKRAAWWAAAVVWGVLALVAALGGSVGTAGLMLDGMNDGEDDE